MAKEAAPAPAAAAIPEAEYEDVKFSGIRRAISKSMHTSLSTMAQLTHNTSFDATAILAYRKLLKASEGECSGITLGDIVLYDGCFYVYFLESIVDLILEQFTMVGNLAIKLIQVDSNFLDDYKREYEEFEFIVTSERIDTIISRIIGGNREKVQEKIKNKLVLVNGDVLTKTSYVLHENDIFSIKYVIINTGDL